MRTAQASPDRLRRVAVRTVPFLRVEDRMIRGKLQLPDVFTLIHCYCFSRPSEKRIIQTSLSS
ncbi:hypothetical protein I79_007828 [Cricetulus griseus]|uniref:Uncharacterized protein n=1 Tax=Cricetulus griseus TaxID=10029 RepID=G3HBJ7_CRIGR|nr:hypothetical protein I79_007828 [Cricetulus griseus]